MPRTLHDCMLHSHAQPIFGRIIIIVRDNGDAFTCVSMGFKDLVCVQKNLSPILFHNLDKNRKSLTTAHSREYVSSGNSFYSCSRVFLRKISSKNRRMDMYMIKPVFLRTMTHRVSTLGSYVNRSGGDGFGGTLRSARPP